MKKVFDNFNYMICEHKAQANDNKHFNNNTKNIDCYNSFVCLHRSH